MKEVWKQIPGFEGMYEISSLGNIKSLDREILSPLKNMGNLHIYGRQLKPRKDRGGYLTIKLSGGKFFKVHRLVGFAFFPEKYFEGAQINHINSLRHDNRAINLEWATSSQNAKHGFVYGNRKNSKGEDSIRAKILEKDVLKIFEMGKEGFSQGEIGRIFGISQTQVHRILKKKRWAHVRES